MAKKTRPTKHATSEPDSFTFSTRVTHGQKDLIERAASLRGWSPSTFIRIAATERAAHIINTSTRTKFDIRSFAREVAKQLIEPEVWINADDAYGERVDLDVFNEQVGNYSPGCSRFDRSKLDALRNALRFGGAEFLTQVMDVLDDMQAPITPELPDPVKPE